MIAFAHETEAADARAEIEAILKEELPIPEPRKAQPPKSEAKQDKPAKDEPEKDVPEKVVPEKDVSAKNEPAKEEARKEEPKEEPKKEAPPVNMFDVKAADIPVPLMEPAVMASGPVISEEERARMAAAEDALDRDLAAARRKKEQEIEFMAQMREKEKQLEDERLSRARAVQQRHAHAAEVAAQKAEEAAAKKKAAENTYSPEKLSNKAVLTGGASSHGTNAVRTGVRERQFNNTLLSMAAMRLIAIFVVMLIGLYVAAFIYAKNINEDFFESLSSRLSNQNKLVSDSSIPYEIPEDLTSLTFTEKKNRALSVGLADSDKDGLTDEYEINVSGTGPGVPDSDGDTVLDGAEVRAGLDPLNSKTDGKTHDSEVLRDNVLTEGKVTANITNIPKTAFVTLTKVANNSIQGTPGLVGYACELYSDRHFEDCEIVFSFEEEDLIKGGRRLNESALSVFRFNDEELLFEKVQSSYNARHSTVSAHVTENGIYALCSNEMLVRKGKTNIFFLIDNSGSMYPEELCANSEENDVEFKRLDFATDLIDMLGVEANYGAGEFSGGYANIVPISSNYENVKTKISDIRNKHQVFSGTEIAGAITNAVNEFGSDNGFDRNYIILLTDGMPSLRDHTKDEAAITAAQQHNITIFTIGLGKHIDVEYLNEIAMRTNGQFFQATNANALANIYEKIQNFMTYNQITIEEGTDRKGYIIADSGFNVLKDSVGYNNFRADFAENGADVGIAGLIRAYYRGELREKTEPYVTKDGKTVPGYDISGIEGIVDGKVDLKDIEIDVLTAYNEYLAMPKKWDYRTIDGGVLHFTEETRDFIDAAGLRVTTAPFKFEMPDETYLEALSRRITFNTLKPFTEYECVLLDAAVCKGNDAAVMSMIRWYNSIPYSDEMCDIYDFGYDGDRAFDELCRELSTGSPAVITYGDSAMNAVRLTRDVYDPNLFILEAYDCNTPERNTKITLQRTPIYDDHEITYQYAASRNSVEEPLRIVVMD